VPTAYGQLTTANILSDSFNFDPIVSSDNYDGGYVQFPKAGDPQHVLYKYKVGLGNNASVNPSPDTLNLQFVDDTQEAQKFGILYFERLVDKSADVQAEAWPDMMGLNPDAVLGISGALYDSAVNADMVIDSLSISADMIVSIKGEQFDHSLSIFGDLEPPALSIAVDDSTGAWTPIIVGPDGTDSQGNNLNALTKHLQITSGGTIKVGTLPSIDGGLLIDDTHIAGYSTTGTKTLELIYAGTNQGDAYFGDYDSGNHGLKYDHSAGSLNLKGEIVATSGELQTLNITDTLTLTTGGQILAGTVGSNRVEITSDAIKGISDTLGTTFNLPTNGSAPIFSSGTIKEVEFQIYTSGVIKTNSDPTTNGGLLINNTSLRGWNSSGTKLIELVYDGTNEGDVYFGDYDNNNSGIKYDHSANSLNIRGMIGINGYMQSSNWGTSAGTKFDLTNETLILGGSSDPSFSYSPSNGLYIKGIESNTTVTVGTGGDFSSMNAALEYLHRLKPRYDVDGVIATINLLSGFTVEEQIIIYGLDLGWVEITGADSSTTVSTSAITKTPLMNDYGWEIRPVFAALRGGVLPRIKQVFRADSNTLFTTGVLCAESGSTVNISDGGFENFGNNGIYAYYGGSIFAYNSSFDDCFDCIFAFQGGKIIVDGSCTATNAGRMGVYADRGSSISCQGIDASGAATNGVRSESGSNINARLVNGQMGATPSSSDIVVSNGSIVNATGATGGLSQTSNTVTANGIIFK
jgi:hypothetical protein